MKLTSFITLIGCVCRVSAFLSRPQALARICIAPTPQLSFRPMDAANVPPNSSRPSTKLHGTPPSVDGSGRGAVLLGISLLVCVWIFSIPPYYRRAHICPDDDYCRVNLSAASCYNCVTAQEWKDGIIKYYRNGGGVNFDFSVAPETKQFWDQALGFPK